MRKGSSKYDYLDQEETTLAVRYLKAGKTNEDIAALLGWPVIRVRDCRAQFFPTTELAGHYLRANALTMAQRVVSEGDVKEMLDVLSRPNIGVLHPIAKTTEGKTGVFVSTNHADLGGVAVAVVTGGPTSSLLEEGEVNGNHEWIAQPRPDGERGPVAPLALVGPWPGSSSDGEASRPRDAAPVGAARVEGPQPVAPVKRERPRHPKRPPQRRAPHGRRRPAVSHEQHGSRRHDGTAPTRDRQGRASGTQRRHQRSPVVRKKKR